MHSFLLTNKYLNVIILYQKAVHAQFSIGQRMGNTEIDYEKIAAYFSKSERTFRRWEKEKPSRFKMYVANYMRENELSSENDCVIMMTAAFKGGVGKSTVADALGYYLDETIILNVDIAQSAKKINACPTIDYADMYDIPISEVIDDLSSKYRYIIIDTPGDYTTETQNALPYVQKFIIPMNAGKRSRDAIETTLHTFFGEGSILSGDIPVFFFFNQFTEKEKNKEEKSAYHAANQFKKMFSEFSPSENIKLSAKLSTLGNSLTVETAEERGMSIKQLAEENANAYRSASAKINGLCKSIETFFDL